MNIFLLEDDWTRVAYFRQRFPDATITHIQSCSQADQFQPPYDVIFLDHDLGGRQMETHEDCGQTFVEMVKDRIPAGAFVVCHSFNDGAAMRMGYLLHTLGARVIVAPFRMRDFEAAVAHL